MRNVSLTEAVADYALWLRYEDIPENVLVHARTLLADHLACAFGGSRLDVLYITTARSGLSEEQLEEYPLSGSLFYCKPGAKGVQTNFFLPH